MCLNVRKVACSTCLGGYFLCMLACVGSFSVTGTGTCMGMAVGLVSVSIGWFLLMLNHVSYTYQKL